MFRTTHKFGGKQYAVSVWEPGSAILKCKGPLCGIDSETLLIENKFTWPQVVVAGFSSCGEVQIVPWQYLDQYQSKFIELNPTTKFVFFNNAFDINVMGRDLWLREMEKDGRIMELSVSYKLYLAGTQGWIPRKLTLYDVAKKLIGVELNKEDGTRTSFTRDSQLTKQQILYLAEDCIATEQCGLIVNNMPTETLQARASFVLSEISHNGLLVDQAHLQDMRAKLALKMADLAKELRTFGFVVKRDTDKLTQLQRIDRVCASFGCANVASHTEASGKKQFPRAALWILTANLLALLQQFGLETMPSDITDVITAVVSPVFDPSVDWSAKNKLVKQLEDQATSGIREWLAEFGCDDAVPEKAPKADVALTILEILDQFYHEVTEFSSTNIMPAVAEEFQMCYDENLGWLPGTKPQTNSEFIQEHLRGLLRNNPGLELPLTDAAQDTLKEYLATCRKQNIPPDPQEISKKAIYACKRQEMWRLKDMNISDPFLDKYTEYKHAEKLLGTYFNPEHVAEDGRVHSRYSDFLITGRTASSSPNVQNLPREKGLREMYLAPKGSVLVSCDYGMEEMITLAATLKAWFGKSRMADAINAGYCLHCLFALYRDGGLQDIDINNLTDPEIVKVVKERCAPYKQDKVLKARRQVAKIANFGLGADMSAPTFYLNFRNQGMDITYEEVEQLREDWFNLWLEMKQYINPTLDCVVDADIFDKKKKSTKEEDEDENLTISELTEQIQKKKINLYRAQNLAGIWRVRSSKQAILNFPFQSLAAVISKRALWLVFLDSIKRGYKLVNFIHDEIIAEVKEEMADEVAKSMEALMLQAGRDILPDMRMTAEPCLMRRWSKAAEPAFDAEGKLIPWEDAIA